MVAQYQSRSHTLFRRFDTHLAILKVFPPWKRVDTAFYRMVALGLVSTFLFDGAGLFSICQAEQISPSIAKERIIPNLRFPLGGAAASMPSHVRHGFVPAATALIRKLILDSGVVSIKARLSCELRWRMITHD